MSRTRPVFEPACHGTRWNFYRPRLSFGFWDAQPAKCGGCGSLGLLPWPRRKGSWERYMQRRDG